MRVGTFASPGPSPCLLNQSNSPDLGLLGHQIPDDTLLIALNASDSTLTFVTPPPELRSAVAHRAGHGHAVLDVARRGGRGDRRYRRLQPATAGVSTRVEATSRELRG